MIDVHGMDAAGIAGGNARAAAVAGAITMAKRWIHVLTAIQQQQRAATAPPKRTDQGGVG